jgi:hypothetical protein
MACKAERKVSEEIAPMNRVRAITEEAKLLISTPKTIGRQKKIQNSCTRTGVPLKNST